MTMLIDQTKTKSTTSLFCKNLLYHELLDRKMTSIIKKGCNLYYYFLDVLY